MKHKYKLNFLTMTVIKDLNLENEKVKRTIKEGLKTKF